MQELEKILEEIEKNKHIIEIFGRGVYFVPLEATKQIIRKHMNDGWIPVEERLPEDDEMMLVTCETKSGRRSVNRAWYGNGFWHGSGSMSGVIAWQSLPETYHPERSNSYDGE